MKICLADKHSTSRLVFEKILRRNGVSLLVMDHIPDSEVLKSCDVLVTCPDWSSKIECTPELKVIVLCNEEIDYGDTIPEAFIRLPRWEDPELNLWKHLDGILNEPYRQSDKTAPEEDLPVVLLVDDSLTIASLLGKRLSDCGYKVLIAENGTEGFCLAFEYKPDLVITDVEMPRMNGYQLCRLLKNHPETAGIPVVISTIRANAVDEFWAEKTGADAFLVKGFNPKELQSLCKELIKPKSKIRPQVSSVGQFDYTQIIEEVNKLLDEQLFQHALINDIRSLMEYASDYSLSMKKCSQFIQRIVSHDMCGIFLNGNDFILSLNSPVTLADESNFIKHCCKRLGVDTEEIRAEKITQQEFISCAIEPRFVISEKKDLHSVHAGLSFSYDRPVKSLDIYLYSKERDIDNAVHRRFLKMLLPELHLVMENAFLYRKNLELQKLLKSYVSGSAWNNALSQTEPESDKTDHKVIYESVMFADLCGFTTLVETMSPEETIEFLNHVFSVLTEIVLEFDGDVDKYMGDCIMVRFSNPSNAIKAAFRMQIQLTELSQELKLPKLLMRIGIHSGKVIQGSIGSRIRRELTIVGDTVNVASRMETSCPVGSILITEETYSQVKDLCRLVHSDIILVKGKRKPLKVYEVASPVETTAKEKNEAG